MLRKVINKIATALNSGTQHLNRHGILNIRYGTPKVRYGIFTLRYGTLKYRYGILKLRHVTLKYRYGILKVCTYIPDSAVHGLPNIYITPSWKNHRHSAIHSKVHDRLQ